MLQGVLILVFLGAAFAMGSVPTDHLELLHWLPSKEGCPCGYGDIVLAQTFMDWTRPYEGWALIATLAIVAGVGALLLHRKLAPAWLVFAGLIGAVALSQVTSGSANWWSTSWVVLFSVSLLSVAWFLAFQVAEARALRGAE